MLQNARLSSLEKIWDESRRGLLGSGTNIISHRLLVEFFSAHVARVHLFGTIFFDLQTTLQLKAEKYLLD